MVVVIEHLFNFVSNFTIEFRNEIYTWIAKTVIQVVTKEKIDDAEAICQMHFGHPVYGEQAKFNREGWEYILNQHGGPAKSPFVLASFVRCLLVG